MARGGACAQGHRFCNECWAGHLASAIGDGGALSAQGFDGVVSCLLGRLGLAGLKRGHIAKAAAAAPDEAATSPEKPSPATEAQQEAPAHTVAQQEGVRHSARAAAVAASTRDVSDSRGIPRQRPSGTDIVYALDADARAQGDKEGHRDELEERASQQAEQEAEETPSRENWVNAYSTPLSEAARAIYELDAMQREYAAIQRFEDGAKRGRASRR